MSMKGELYIPSVAVLLSTYNGQLFINEQLESICKQKYSNVTLVIRDDGSSDETRDFINLWREKINIKFIDAKENLGPALSFMELTKLCGDYDYYAFCDQDDVWDNDKLQIAILTLENEIGPALYFCNNRIVDSMGRILTKGIALNTKYITIESELTAGFCPGCAMVFNHQLMNEVRQHQYTYVPMHDMVFTMTALAIGNVIYDSSIHFSRRIHGGNVVAKGGKNYIQRIKQMYQRWIVDSKKNPLDAFVNDFIKNTQNKNAKYDLAELMAMANYKANIKNKLIIWKSEKFITPDHHAMRSFRIRLLLNLL